MRNQSFALLKNLPCLLNILLSLEILLLSNFILLRNLINLPPRIPLWFSQFFLSDRLDTPTNILFIPAIGITFFFINLILTEKLLAHKEHLLAFAFSLLSLTIQLFLALSTLRIILVTVPNQLQIPPYYLTILASLAIAYLFGFIFSPVIIRLAKRFGLMDDPSIRQTQHPAILHKRPTPRAGALPIFLSLLITGLLFLPFSTKIVGIYIGALIATGTGILDDKYDLSPYLRLFLQILAAVTVLVAGVGITYLSNPFGGLLWLNQINFNLFGHQIFPVAFFFALFWIIWVMNMVNWSNGVDGQFPAIVAVAAIVIGILSLRLVPFDEKQLDLVILAAITAGAVLGTAPFNWHPAKMFYGFGSTMVGLVLASIAILAGAKVATALLVLIVPTFDAVITILRRLRQGRSPVWGDRSHLHHRLYSLGWSQPKIATFYCLTTGFFGLLALYSSGKYKLLTIIAGAGMVAFLLVILRQRIKLIEEKPHET